MGEGDEEEGVEEEGGVVLPCVSCARVRRDAVGGGEADAVRADGVAERGLGVNRREVGGGWV